jgi:hypothetical protein
VAEKCPNCGSDDVVGYPVLIPTGTKFSCRTCRHNWDVPKGK